MDTYDLKESFESIDYYIDTILKEEIKHPYGQSKKAGRRIWGLLTFYHSRANLKYLLDADIDGFFEDLSREALTYRTFLKAYHNQIPVPESNVDSSYYPPFLCAIATANFELCRELDGLMPQQFGQHDQEEPFAVTMMFRKLAVQDEKACKTALAYFKQHCDGVDQFTPLIQATAGLVQKDEDLYNAGLIDYLNCFNKLSDDEIEELEPGEAHLSLEGLACIQLACQRGLKTKVTHPMIPEPLQQAKVIIPQDGYPPWPEPEG